MRLKGSYVTAILILAVCIAWIASGVLTKPASSDADKQKTSSTLSHHTTVSVIDSVARPVTAQIKLTGKTVANRKVDIKSETSGRVITIYAERGQHLKAEAPILKLSEDDRRAHVRQAQSLLSQREIEYKAASRLSSKAFASKVKVATARADRDAAAASLSAARLDLQRTIIKAPFDGILDNRPVHTGDYLSVGGMVATLIDLDPLEVEIQVPETRVGYLRTGNAVSLKMPDGAIMDGIITYIAAASETSTRTFTVKIEMPNADLTYGDGMTVIAVLPLEQTRAHFITPAILTLSEDGQVGINTVDDNDTVVFYPIKLVREDTHGLWVTGKNMPAQFRLITIGQDYVKAGQVVSPQPDNVFQNSKNPG